MQPLTARQRQVYDYIAAHLAEHQAPPTVREICQAMAIRSPQGVRTHLLALKRKGWITLASGVARNIRLVDAKKGIPLLSLEALGAVDPW